MNLLQNIQIDKIVFGGQAMARREEGQKVLFVWNALPGEVVDVEITKQKKTYLEVIAIDIKKA